MYGCMYVCMYVYIIVCMYVYTDVYMHASMHVCIYIVTALLSLLTYSFFPISFLLFLFPRTQVAWPVGGHTKCTTSHHPIRRYMCVYVCVCVCVLYYELLCVLDSLPGFAWMDVSTRPPRCVYIYMLMYTH